MIAALAIVLLALFALKGLDIRFSETSAGVISGLLLGSTVYCWRKPAVFAAIVAFIFVANAYCFTYDRGNHVVRNFFGVLNAANPSTAVSV